MGHTRYISVAFTYVYGVESGNKRRRSAYVYGVESGKWKREKKKICLCIWCGKWKQEKKKICLCIWCGKWATIATFFFNWGLCGIIIRVHIFDYRCRIVHGGHRYLLDVPYFSFHKLSGTLICVCCVIFSSFRFPKHSYFSSVLMYFDFSNSIIIIMIIWYNVMCHELCHIIIIMWWFMVCYRCIN